MSFIDTHATNDFFIAVFDAVPVPYVAELPPADGRAGGRHGERLHQQDGDQGKNRERITMAFQIKEISVKVTVFSAHCSWKTLYVDSPMSDTGS